MGWVSISELLLDLTDLGHKKDTCISEQSKMSRLGCGSKLWSRSTLATNNYVWKTDWECMETITASAIAIYILCAIYLVGMEL